MTEGERRAIEADCERLIKRYVNLNDAQDWPAVAALYTEDARMGRPSQPGTFVEGRAAILAAFEARAPRVHRHLVSNIVVEVEDAHTATAFSVLVLYQSEPAEEGELPEMSDLPLVGWYRDKLVRTADGWRFAERVGGLDFNP